MMWFVLFDHMLLFIERQGGPMEFGWFGVKTSTRPVRFTDTSGPHYGLKTGKLV